MGFKINGVNTKNRISSAISPVDFQHVLCEGTTGSGKTASLILPTLEDRLAKGHTIIFFDHKGHEHKKVKALAKKAGRIKDVVEIGKPHSAYINLLAELDTIRLKEMIKETGASRDPYWANSSANLVEDIIAPLRKLYDLMNALKGYRVFTTNTSGILKSLEEIGIDIYEKPSFQTLSSIVASPKTLVKYKDAIADIPSELERVLSMDYKYGEEEVENRRQVLAKILSLKKSIQASARFTLSEDKSDTNTGNNAVLQILDNTIASYAKKDYINVDEYTIAGLMDSNAIIVIDTQSFGEDIMKLFLESILKKAVMRLRTGTEKPMSVFIDEANRVLFPSIDLHSDVLREAKVELVVAIQNQEQMVSKFSQIVWDSIKGNIKHQYFIDIKHRLSYNSSDYRHIEPLFIEEEKLIDADYLFYTLEKNQTNIQKNFLGEIDMLPDKFTVICDLDRFEHESAIVVEDKYGEQYVMSYHGEEIVNEVNNTFPAEAAEEFVIDEDFTKSIDHKAIMCDADRLEFTLDELMGEVEQFDEDDIDDDPYIDIDFDDSEF